MKIHDYFTLQQLQKPLHVSVAFCVHLHGSVCTKGILQRHLNRTNAAIRFNYTDRTS